MQSFPRSARAWRALFAPLSVVLLAAAVLAPRAALAQGLSITGVSGPTWASYDDASGTAIFTVAFTVKNTGALSAYAMVVGDCGPFVSSYTGECVDAGGWRSAGYLAPGQSVTVAVSIVSSDQNPSSGRVTLSGVSSPTTSVSPPYESETAMVSLAGPQSATLIPPPLASFQPAVTPKPASVVVPPNAATSETFTVQNNGTRQATYTLTPTCGAMAGCSANKATTTINPGATDNVVVTFTTPAALSTANTVTLRATYTNVLNQTVADTGLIVATTTSEQPQVAPKTGTTILAAGGGSAQFTVFGIRSTDAMRYVPICTGWMISCAVSDVEVVDDPEDPNNPRPPLSVTVNYTTLQRAGNAGDPTIALRLAAQLLSAGQVVAADTGSIAAMFAYSRPVLSMHGGSTQLPTASVQTGTLTITNTGNATSPYSGTLSCTAGMACVVTPLSFALGAGQSQVLSYTYRVAQTVGATESAQLIVSNRSQFVEADTLSFLVTAADLTAPTITLTAPSDGSVVTTGAISIGAFVCDVDGQLLTPTATMNGAAVTTTFTSAAQTGCLSTKSGTFPFVLRPGINTFVVSASDGYHTPSVTRSVTYDESVETTPVVISTTATRIRAGGAAATETFSIRNPGPVAMNYALTARCVGGALGCTPSTSTTSLTSGQTTTVSIGYTTATSGASAVVALDATLTANSGRTVTASAADTLTLDQLAPTIRIATPSANAVVSAYPDISVTWCDADGALATHSVSLDGAVVSGTFVAATVSGCVSAGTMSWSALPMPVGAHTLTANATDAVGHTSVVTESFTFSLPPLASYQPQVTPVPASKSFLPGPGVAPFVVRNVGTLIAHYTLVPGCPTAGACTVDKPTLTLPPGASDTARISFTVPNAPLATGTLTLTSTYQDIAARTVSDVGQMAGSIPSTAALYQPQVLDPTPGTFPAGLISPYTFQARNAGLLPATYQVSTSATNGYEYHAGALPDSITIMPGQTVDLMTEYRVPAGTPANGDISLTLTYTSPGGVTVTSTGHGSMGASQQTAPTTISVAVSPRSIQPDAPMNTTFVREFDIVNTGSGASAFAWSVSCSGAFTCGDSSGVTATLVNLQTVPVLISYQVGATLGATGAVKFRAVSTVNAAAVDSGVVSGTVEVASPLRVVVADVNAGTTVAREVCLTISAGDGAAYECGDLRLAHALPTTTTMNKARTPTLVYNSAQATGKGVIAADVVAIPGVNMSTLLATLSVTLPSGAVHSFPTKSFSWDPSHWNNGTRRRIALPFDADALGLSRSAPAGAFTYQITVKSADDATVTASATGTVVVIDRRASPFGAGWWLDGFEQLSFITAGDTSKRLWIGGDGSSRMYSRVAHSDTVWTVQPAVDRVDSLVRTGGGIYRRLLPNGAYVEFDGSGQHQATVNELGHRTTFASTTHELRSITLPVASGAAPQYQFFYERSVDTNTVLTRVSSPGNRVDSVAYDGATARLTKFFGRDGTSIQFGFAATTSDALVRSRTNRNGAVTIFAFDSASKLSSAAGAMGAGTSYDSIKTTFCAAESASLSVCGGSLQLTDQVRTLYDGPRHHLPTSNPSYAPDTAAYYLTAFGAPRKIVKANGDSTIVERTDTLWRFLPTAVVQPNGYRVEARYLPDRGLLQQTTERSPLGGSDAITSYSWHGKWDELVGTHSPMTRYADGVVDTIAYSNLLPHRIWQQRGTDVGRRVAFNYDDNNTKLVSSTLAPGAAPDSVVYDAATGNAIGLKSSAGYWTTILRDAVGRDTVTLTAVDATDHAHDSTETRRTKVATMYDAFDRVVDLRSSGFVDGGVQPPLQTLAVVNHYDNEGNLIEVDRSSVPDINAIQTMITRYVYDAAGRRVAEEAPDHARDSTVYDPAGNVIWNQARTGDVVTMSYDTLNRLSVRRTAQKTFGVESPYVWVTFPMHPIGGTSGVTVPADVATFTYDKLGHVTTANNGDAQVARSYYTNGSLKDETQRIRTYADSDFSQHVFTVGYWYDLDGRRIGIARDPSDTVLYGYLPQTGDLQSINALRSGATFAFGYDAAGRLSATHLPGGITDTSEYDTGDHLIRRTETGGNYLRTLPNVGLSHLIHADTLAYDARGKVTSNGNFIGATYTQYNGLGAIEFSTRSTLAGGSVPEYFTPDALGNDQVSVAGNAAVPTTFAYAHDGTGRLTGSATLQQSAALTDYDAAGNQTHYGHIESLAHNYLSSLTRSYYGGDGKLRVADRRVTASYEQPNGTLLTGAPGAIAAGAQADQLDALEEYRYDALGRRVLKRSRRTTCEPVCLSTIERYVWDGDNLLREFRQPGGDTLSASALENDDGVVARVDSVQFHDLDPVTIDTVYSPYYGRVTYTHAGGMDRPIMLERHDYGQASQFWGDVAIVLHYDFKGIVDEGTLLSGYSTASQSLNADWPGTDVGVFGTQQNHGLARSWFGSLPDGMRDATGFQYRRNRYYDPTSGRFTQEDPIGLGGGINLYGFAGGDPVNFGDPLGLSALDCPPACPGAAGAAGAAVGAAGAAVGLLQATSDANVVAAGINAAIDAAKDKFQLKFVTYTRAGPGGQVYSGRTSGFGDPQSIVAARASGHPDRLQGFGPPTVDRWSAGVEGYAAIRGREQQLIDAHGGARSDGGSSANVIRGVSKRNPLAPLYSAAAVSSFGPPPSAKPVP